jgi:hypothetical protein
MPISFEITGPARREAPPFSDGCPKCVFDGVVIPYATFTAVHNDSLMAFYHHGRCGHEWYTSWSAQYSHTWQRVIGQSPQQIAA